MKLEIYHISNLSYSFSITTNYQNQLISKDNILGGEGVKYEAYFKEFDYEYIGKYEYNSTLKQYDIIISKGADNGGAFLDEGNTKN